MIGLLLFPILVCGYLFITAWPAERVKMSLYHGWSLYIRAAAYGIIIVTTIFLLLGIALPAIGLYIGKFLFHIFPDTNIFKLLSNLIASSYIFHSNDNPINNPSLDIASISIVCIATTWLFKGILYISSSTNLPLLTKQLKKTKEKSIEKLFKAKSPVEYQLLTIAKKAKEDIKYNKIIEGEREKIYAAIVEGNINRKERAKELPKIFEVLKYRVINYALISLDNEKFYIGLPTIIPDPDEESVASNSIQIIPTWSGYRDEKRTLNFTTEYDFDINNTSDYERISISREKVISVSGFIFERHERISITSKNMQKR